MLSSNAFLQPIRLTSVPRLRREGRWVTVRRSQLILTARGELFLADGDQLHTASWLRERSFWAREIAGLSLRDANQRSFVLWFLRAEQQADQWRRARVRFLYPC
jgi:hypothetical protein